jgi:hypothetical protein
METIPEDGDLQTRSPATGTFDPFEGFLKVEDNEVTQNL